jgi:hypothetical protein
MWFRGFSKKKKKEGWIDLVHTVLVYLNWYRTKLCSFFGFFLLVWLFRLMFFF